jgi:tripartite-type tricarboxylate transporter receptor subunit TctC
MIGRSAILPALCVLLGTAQAAPYPIRAIEIVVGYGAGGSTDLVARTIAQRLQDRLGQSVVVINRPGASGTIAVASVLRAAPDGYTLLAAFTTEIVVAPQTQKSAKYSVADFEPIAVTSNVPLVMIGGQRLQSTTLPDLIAEIRRSPGKFTFGGGVGSPSHLSGSWMNRLKGLDVVYVPYKGGSQAVGDVVGGHLDMFYAGLAPAKGAVSAGVVKAYAVTGETRSPAFPDVPTFRQAGVPDFELGSWTALLAPKGTPADIIALLKSEVTAALDTAQVRNVLQEQGVEPPPSRDPTQFLAAEELKFGRLVKELGLTMGP